MVIICTVCAVILFLCGLMKTMSGYGAGTGIGCMALAILWLLYLHAGVEFTPELINNV